MPTHKILVIDDSKVIRMRVKDMLPEGNFDVIEAKDGLEGFNLIRTENPNLIMLDFLLPKMSGWEVYQEIQKQQKYRSIPLVLMSGRKEEVTDKLPEPFEYFAFVEKPFDREQLVDAIRDSMVKAKKQPQGLSTGLSEESSSPPSADIAAVTSEVKALKLKVAKLEQESEQLKRQFNQLVSFIKQKFK
ncbi:response regulator [Pleurocapsa sp. PCC 7319]|uniref:response regulator n=1 Tax=Pleurocapsa sp. PCC 7319 TaxID=118161 RepID=UPI00036A0899|nr:response regulator [Pleurocapsa sp. PCC 7319]